MLPKVLLIKIMEYLQYKDKANYYRVFRMFRLLKLVRPILTLGELKEPNDSYIINRNKNNDMWIIIDPISKIRHHYDMMRPGIMYILDMFKMKIKLYWTCEYCNNLIEIKYTFQIKGNNIDLQLLLEVRNPELSASRIINVLKHDELRHLFHYDGNVNIHFDGDSINEYECKPCRKQVLEDTKYDITRRYDLARLSRIYKHDYEMDFIVSEMKKIIPNSDKATFSNDQLMDKAIRIIFNELEKGPAAFGVNEDGKDYTYYFVRKSGELLVEVVYANPSPRIKALTPESAKYICKDK